MRACLARQIYQVELCLGNSPVGESFLMEVVDRPTGRGYIHAVVGANWGDEGKGKVVDFLAKDAALCCRFQGGANAGHSIFNEHGKVVLHMVPSGACYSTCLNIIGLGVAVDLERLQAELADLAAKGIRPHLIIADRAQMLMPYHKDFDAWEEARRSSSGVKAFGSTRTGIAPFYSDKYAKIGFQICQLRDLEGLRSALETNIVVKEALAEHVYKDRVPTVDEMMERFAQWRDFALPLAGDVQQIISDALAQGKLILAEGQLGTMKDIEHGIYPFVTSSSTLAANACVSLGAPPMAMRRITVVVKAYSSAVGEGAFVVELDGDIAKRIRDHGADARLGGPGEYGATTGRPRRVGWLDLVASRYGVQLQGGGWPGVDVAMTVLDPLGEFDEIPVCVAYEIDGERVTRFPTSEKLARAKPIYRVMTGWRCSIGECRSFHDLPKPAQDYVLFAESEIGTKIRYIGVGPRRDDMIVRD